MIPAQSPDTVVNDFPRFNICGKVPVDFLTKRFHVSYPVHGDSSHVYSHIPTIILVVFRDGSRERLWRCDLCRDAWDSKLLSYYVCGKLGDLPQPLCHLIGEYPVAFSDFPEHSFVFVKLEFIPSLAQECELVIRDVVCADLKSVYPDCLQFLIQGSGGFLVVVFYTQKFCQFFHLCGGQDFFAEFIIELFVDVGKVTAFCTGFLQIFIQIGECGCFLHDRSRIRSGTVRDCRILCGRVFPRC